MKMTSVFIICVVAVFLIGSDATTLKRTRQDRDLGPIFQATCSQDRTNGPLTVKVCTLSGIDGSLVDCSVEKVYE